MNRIIEDMKDLSVLILYGLWFAVLPSIGLLWMVGVLS